MKAVRTLTRSAFFSLLVAAGFTLGAAQAAEYSSRTIRLGYVLNETHPQGLGAKRLAEIVAQKSGGKIKVQNFGNGVLGDEVKMMSAVQGGVLDMFIVTTAPLAGAVKEFGVLDVPFLSADIERAVLVQPSIYGADVQGLLRLLREGRAYVKLSGVNRISAQPYPHEDVLPFVRALVASHPQRLLWGSDWPHPLVQSTPNDGDIANLIARWLPGQALREQVLVSNPAALYGFNPT